MWKGTFEKNKIIELDVLRGISCLVILFFHLDKKYIPGAIYFMDLFFFLSGFLIVRSITLQKIKDNKLSLRIFFIKRILRLYPTLCAVLFLCLFYGLFVLSPNSLIQLAKQNIAAIFNYINFLFTAGNTNFENYFKVSSKFTILLHTWSISIEEQFYVLTALFFWALSSKNKIIIWSIILILITSLFLVMNINWDFAKKESIEYYLLPYRLFPFLLGGLFFFLKTYFNLKFEFTYVKYILIRLVSFILLFSPLYFITKSVYKPQVSFVICLAVCLIILSRHKKYPSIIFKNKFLKIIGNMSYTIYLVHWPIYSYGFRHTINDLKIENKIINLLLTILLSIPIYYFIDKKMRYSINKKVNLLNLKWTSFFISLLLISSLIIIKFDGFNWRIKDKKSKEFILNSTFKSKPSFKFCVEYKIGFCERGYKNSIFIMGDSYTTHIIPGLIKNFPNTQFVLFNHPKCLYMMPGVSKYPDVQFKYIDANKKISCVIYNKHIKYVLNKYKPKLIMSGRFETSLYLRKEKISTTKLHEEVSKLQHKVKKLMILNTPPRFKGHYSGSFNAIDICENIPITNLYKPIHCDMKVHHIKRKFDNLIPKINEPNNLVILDLKLPFCKKNICKVRDETGLYFADGSHLSNLGAIKAIDYFIKDFNSFIHDK